MSHLTVLITGASSGIGEATAEAFAAKGARLILAARRLKRLEALAARLQEQYTVHVRVLEMDVQQRDRVEQAVSSLPSAWSDIDVLVNNAGLALSSSPLQDGDPVDWDCMIDTNIKGLLYVTRAVLPGMLARDRGHVINLGSIAGHECYPGGNVYCATKHAVKALSKSVRLDLLGTPIRVSSIDPGAVSTEFSAVRWQDKAKADDFYSQFEALQAEDIAKTVVFCAEMPPHVNIAEMIVMPTCQGSANHLHRSSSSS